MMMMMIPLILPSSIELILLFISDVSEVSDKLYHTTSGGCF
jgi:hypothetical protein